MRFVILTGMSGAGKNTAMKMMEDIGFYCVDNLPVPLLDKFMDLATLTVSAAELQKVAVGIDVRNGQALGQLKEILEHFRSQGKPFEILFLDAEDAVLVKRYKETRRNHPLADQERIDKGITLERERMTFLREHADYIIDTSRLLTRELKAEINKIFVDNQDYKNLFITVLSFGYKYGIPADSDLVFDVRFLPNPYYVEGLREKTGLDTEIQDYVMQFPEAHTFLDKLVDLVNFLIPNYIAEGKNQLVISIGCTGGKHRSVTLAGELYKRLANGTAYGLKMEHRDIDKDAKRK